MDSYLYPGFKNISVSVSATFSKSISESVSARIENFHICICIKSGYGCGYPWIYLHPFAPIVAILYLELCILQVVLYLPPNYGEKWMIIMMKMTMMMMTVLMTPSSGHLCYMAFIVGLEHMLLDALHRH